MMRRIAEAKRTEKYWLWSTRRKVLIPWNNYCKKRLMHLKRGWKLSSFAAVQITPLLPERWGGLLHSKRLRRY